MHYLEIVCEVGGVFPSQAGRADLIDRMRAVDMRDLVVANESIMSGQSIGLSALRALRVPLRIHMGGRACVFSNFRFFDC